MSGPPDQATRRARLARMLHRMGGTLLPRSAIVVGIGTTIAMNVYGGLWDGGAGGAVVAALYPVALVVSLETLIWMMRRFGPPRLPFADHWEQWFATVTLASLAAITGIISYLHALTVLERTGSGHLGWTAVHLGPLVPDQMILTGTLALMAAARLASKTTKPAAERTAERTSPQRAKTTKRTSRAKTNAAEEARIANLVRQLDRIPTERPLAADYCGGNRRMARRVLELVKATNGHGPEGDPR